MPRSVATTDDVVPITEDVEVFLPTIPSEIELHRLLATIDDVVPITGDVEVHSFEVDPTTNVVVRQTMMVSLSDLSQLPSVLT